MREEEQSSRERWTKAQLIEEVQGLEGALARQAKIVEEAESRVAGALDGVDPEARAISACVKALNEHLPAPRSRREYFMEEESRTPRVAAVERVLSHLASRFELPDPYAEIARLRAALRDARQAEASLEELREQLRGAL